MTKIEISSSNVNDKLTQDNIIDLTDLKVHTHMNINVKSLKTYRSKRLIDFLKLNIYLIILVLIILFGIILIIVFGIILKRTQNGENTIQICRIMEENAHKNLQEKIKDLEIKINNIMSRLKYSSHNEMINKARTRLTRSTDYSESFIRKPANQSEIKNHSNSTALTIFDTDDLMESSASVQSLNQTNVLNRNSSILNTTDLISSIRSKNGSIADFINTAKVLPRKDRAEWKMQNYTKVEKFDNETVDIPKKSSRARKWRSDREGRGKKRHRDRRPKRNRRRLDPTVITFVGQIPEQQSKSESFHIGPWIASPTHGSIYNFTKFHLADSDFAIETTINGLFMISVQIFYLPKSTYYSYWVVLQSEGSSTKEKLITCATSSVSTAEVSCYTSVIKYLKKHDRLYIEQQESNRVIDLREGYSQVQLVLLSK